MAEPAPIPAGEKQRAPLRERVFDNLSLPLLLLDSQARILDVNAVTEELLKRSRRRLRGQLIRAVFADSQTLLDKIGTVLETGQNVLIRGLPLYPGPGQELIADCWLRPLGDRGDILLELHAEADRQLLTRSARRQLQAQSLSMLRRTLCHEVRNPLGGMRGAAQILTSALRDKPDLLACAELIIREADRLNTLVERLGQEQIELLPASVRLARIIDNAWQLVRLELENPPRLRLDLDPSIPALDGNADALQQVFLNLFTNASQAGAEEIRVTTRVRHNHPCQGIRYATVVSTQVEDDGDGVPREIEAQLFTPLVSSRAGSGNHGLGLAVAQQIARQHQGELLYTRRPRGSRFELLLPQLPDGELSND